MKGKLAVLTGVGVGYVLGTRAGRERYEQIKSGAQRLWQDPRVKEKRQQAGQMAREQGAAAAHAAKEKVQEKVQHGSGGAHATDSVPAEDLPSSPSWTV